MDDLITIEPLKVKGHVTIQLFDAETGNKVQEESGYNFLTIALNDVLKRLQKSMFSHNIPNNNASCINLKTMDYITGAAYSGVFQWLVLTDSTMAESPSTEKNIPGNIIGYADRNPYSNTDTKRGAINQTESYADDTRAHWVFDFATDRGNGTIGSICFARWNSEGSFMGKLTLYKKGTNFARIYAWMAYGDDGYLYALNSSNKLYKLDPNTFTEIASYTLPYAPSMTYGQSILIVGGYVYYVYNYNSWLIRFKMSDGTYTNTGIALSGSLHYDGTYIYVWSYGPANMVRFNPTTMVQFDSKNLTSVFTTLGVSANSTYEVLTFNNKIYIKLYFTVGYYLWVCYDYASNTFNLSDTLAIYGNADNIGCFNIFAYNGVIYMYGGNSSSYYNNVQLSFYNIYTIDYTGFTTMMSRKLLGTPVTKTSANTMKIIYDFIYS